LHIFNAIYAHQTDSTPDIIYKTQASKVKTNFSAFRCIVVRSAKAYVNHSLALPYAI